MPSTDQPAPRPRRTAMWVALLAAALALPLVMAPLLVEVTGWRLDSVISRSMILGAGVVLLCWVGLPSSGAVGRALGPASWRRVGTALLVTAVCCALYSCVLVLAGAESLRPALFRPDRIATALGTGLIVSAVEEPVFRGVLLRRVSAGGVAAGSIVSSALYSFVHYIRPPKVDTEGPHGLDDTLAVYGAMADNLLGPLRDPVAGIGLFLLGLLLCLVVRRGGLAWTIGIHTGVVYYIKVDATFTYWNHEGRHWLFGSQGNKHDGALFWLVCTAILVAVWRLAPVRTEAER